MSNQPLFDDEDLPAWLRNAGITYGGSGNQPESSTPSPATSSNDDMSWLEESAPTSASGALPFDASLPWDGSSDNPAFDTIPDAPDWMQGLQAAAPSQESAPWMQNTPAPDIAPDTSSTSASLPWEQQASSTDSGPTPEAGFGNTGALPWRQGVSDPADQPVASDNDLNWLDQEPAAESTPASSANDDLAPWQSQPEVEAAAPSVSADDLSWLNSGPPTLPKPPTSEPAEVTADDLNWLSEAAPTTEPAVNEPVDQVQEEPIAPPADAPKPTLKRLPSMQSSDAPVSPPPADAPKPVLKKLPSASPPPADVPKPVLKKLPSASQPPAAPPPPDYSDMTYQEWEQAQADQQAQPLDQSVDEVPDWFKNADAPAPAADEFTPDWFSGAEEPAPDAAPEWFSTTDFNTPLVGPDSIQNQTAAPEPVVASAEDAPDWFKGAASGVEDIDFNSMFVSETPADEPKSTGSLAAKLAELTPEIPTEAALPEAEEPVAEAETADLDWLDMPDLGELTSSEAEQSAVSEAAPVEEPEPELAPAEDALDSLNQPQDVAPSTEMVAPIEEPQADLAPEDAPDWMSQAQDVVPAAEIATPTDDMLDWLNQPQDTAPTAEITEPIEEPQADLAPEEMPNWMSQAQDVVPAAEANAPVEEPQGDLAPTEDAPDWMNAIVAEPSAEISTSVEEPQGDLAPTEDAPDWMNAIVAEPSAEISTSVEEPQADLAPTEDAPDWMSAMASEPSAEMNAPVEEPQGDLAPTEDAPDWMNAIAAEPSAEISTSVEEPQADLAPTEDAPDWMNAIAAEPSAETSAPIEEPQADLAPTEDAPDWMNAIAAEPSAETSAPIEESQADVAPAEDVPDWMSAMASEPSSEVNTPTEEPLADLAPAEDMPDWMNAIAAEPSSEVSAPAEPLADLAPAEDMPDWMSAMAAESSAEMSAPVEPQADLAPAEDVPDWMREMADDSSAAEPQTELTPTEDMPDWMREMAAESSAKSQSDAPDWMEDMDSLGATPMAAPDEGAQEFDWLNNIDTNAVAPAESIELPAAEPEVAPVQAAPIDIDALLNFADSAATVPEPEPVPAEPVTATADEFDFESELEPIVPAETAAPGGEQFDASTLDFNSLIAAATETSPIEPDLPAEPAQPEPPAPASSNRLRRLPKTSEQPAVPVPAEPSPAWIEDVRQTTTGPVMLRIGDQVVRAEERPANILPEELQNLRERARAFAQRPAATPTINAGPLAGITGAIDAIPEPVQPATSAGAASLIVSDLDAKRIKIIQSILGVEEEMLQERLMGDEEREAKQAAAGIKPAAPTRPRPKIDRLIITILLAAVIIAPFFTGILNITSLPDMTQLSPAQASVKDAIDALPADQEVLVAFEYGPTGAGELDDLARVIVRDIVKRGAHPVIVSTNPTGALHAQAVMQSLATRPDDLALMNRADKPLIMRQDYWVLPYLPGGAIGVHTLLNAVLKNNAAQLQFRTDIEGLPTGLTNVSINTLQHNPAFILTESEEDVRNWVEQYQSPAPNQVKLVLLSSAAASAVAQTYVNSSADKHIIGPLVGLRDTMTYQAVRQPPPAGTVTTSSNQRWQSIGLATLLATLLILAGAAYNVIRGLQRRTRR